MTSPADIANRALSEIGTRSSIADFNEASVEARACGLWYDPLRKQLLRAANWGFAREQASLSLLGSLADFTSPYPWPYKYTYPANALRMRYVLPTPSVSDPAVPVTGDPVSPMMVPSRNNRFIIANDRDELNAQRRVLLCTLADAQAVYTVDVTDCGIWDSLFEQAMVSALAAKIVIQLTGNKDMRSSFIQSAMDSILQARAADGNEAKPTTDHTPDWISARGIPAMSYAFDNLGFWMMGYEDLNWGM